MKAAVLALAALAACVSSDAVTCSDGRLCPAGSKCVALTNPNPQAKDPNPEFCATPKELSVCDSVPDGMMCTDGTGTCYGGFCISPPGCGNGWLDPNEVCDDGNQTSGDGCSSDCKSLEVCGNGLVDPTKLVSGMPEPNEQCDDSNTLGHDGCSGMCQLESPTWSQITTYVPDARSGAALAYDSARERVVMFGGSTEFSGLGSTSFGRLGDTWEWDGVDWRPIASTVSPAPRGDAGFVYDRDHHRSVLFGGGAIGSRLADTWEWDGTQWTLDQVAGPPPREGHAMVYDPIRRRVIVFGGLGDNGVLDDTWEWDGTTWTMLALTTKPSARSGAGVAFDPSRGVTVLAGGNDAMGTQATDTWEFDGTSWKQIIATGTPATMQLAAMGWDPVSRKVISYGGVDGSATETAQMWSWDGHVWTQLSVAGPSARTSAALVVDGARSKALLFGGFRSCINCNNGYADTWLWNGTAWTNPTLEASTPPALYDAAVAWDNTRARAVVFGGQTDSGGAAPSNQTWLFERGRWRQVAGTAPEARAVSAMAYDAAHDRVVMFGGDDTSGSGALLGDMWLFDGTSWMQIFPTPIPTPREGHQMAYDATAQRVILWGGTSPQETWEWDGTTWSLRDDGTHAASLTTSNALLFYDPTLGKVEALDTTGDAKHGQWEWDHASGTWIAVPSVPPTARTLAGLAWDGAREHPLVFGGGLITVGTPALNDTWELAGSSWVPATAPNAPFRKAHVMFPAADGAGIVVFGGEDDSDNVAGDTWSLRWNASTSYETCASDVDLDGDGAGGCKDADCWATCTPMCPPGRACDPSFPHCGDGTCNSSLETCRNCPSDCGACTAVCGDGFCDAPETAAMCPGDCP